jgi:hypothetical protein
MSRHILKGITVLVVRGNISSPEDYVGLDLTVDDIAHLSHNINWNVAAECAQWSSLEGWISGKPVDLSAANNVVTNLGRSCAILHVQMNICEVNNLEEWPILPVRIGVDLVVEVVDEIIVGKDGGLVSEYLVRVGCLIELYVA